MPRLKKIKSFLPLANLLLFSLFVSAQENKSKPFELGVIDEIYSSELSETRILNIYIPEGYNASDTVHYAVTYLLDGSADEDFIHISGLYQFNSFEWINRVPKTIVVGIASVDRRRDFTFPTTIEEDKINFPTTGHSEKFISFIEKELQPYIDKKYKTNNSKTIIGQSLGGLLAAEILLKKPQLFNSYIIVSPSIWWDNGSLLTLNSAILEEGYSRPTSVFIAVGKEGLAPTSLPHNMIAEANLLEEKLRNAKNKNLKIYFDYLPDEDHATILHQAVYNAMKVVYGN